MQNREQVAAVMRHYTGRNHALAVLEQKSARAKTAGAKARLDWLWRKVEEWTY